MPETLELLETVSAADISDLFILYLKLQSSDRGDSSRTSSAISLYFTVQKLIIFGYPRLELYLNVWSRQNLS
jgi:hypothetical protein